MRSYLSLVPISAKVRKRQNRLTILCIVFAVFLVTAVFSIADMMTRTENGLMLSMHGNWHIKLENISPDMAEEISRRPDVAVVGASSVFNFNAEEPYFVGEKKAVFYGTEEIYLNKISNGIVEGTFPQNDEEVLLSPNAAEAIWVQVGDIVTLHTPAGDKDFTISGFGTDDKSYYEGQTYLVGVYMTQTAFASLMEQNGISDAEQAYYVQFQSAAKAAKAMPELGAQYQLPEGSISENTGVMAMAGQSRKESVNDFYSTAAIIFVLVMLAGILMISGSMNSNIAQRTQFFGMMRCIGASRRQIIWFVRLEALNWCKTAVPAGMILGTVINWGICGALHYGIGGDFEITPVFQISPVGLLCGAVVGVITVLLAAQSPARRASKVSPVSAVSGNMGNQATVRHGLKTGFGKIDFALGIHHAASAKKNWCLMTASFALSIILFFSFSVCMDFIKLLLPATNVTSADIVLSGYANEMVFERTLVDEIREISGVAKAYGCSYLDHIPAVSSREGVDEINMVSYDDVLLDYASQSVVKGNIEEVYGDNYKVATVFNKDNPLKVGDRIRVGDVEVEVACALSQGLFGDDLIVICSEKTFDHLMGAKNYGLIGVQLGKNAGDETIKELRTFESDKVMFADNREKNRSDITTYWATRIVGYGFLTIIGAITLLNITNSISMSVSARIRQYGSMRAVGMGRRQLTRMIFAEAGTYAASGLVVGCGTGIPFSRFLYTQMITRYMGIAWHLPVLLIGIVAVFVFAAAVLSVYAPASRICNMEITETISEL